jgi:hypothetical protein
MSWPGESDPPEDGVAGLVTDLVERLGGPGSGLGRPDGPRQGSVDGALALCYVGVALGRERIRTVAAKLPRVKVSDTGCARRGSRGKALSFGRMNSIFRSLISVPTTARTPHSCTTTLA